MIIVGAGLAGLIAGHVFPHASIIERQPKPEGAHRALLRFRSDVVSNITGVSFRKVRVHKSVWAGRSHHNTMNPSWANQYAMKTVGRPIARSIWSLEAADRWVAPEDLYERLVGSLDKRIFWGTKFAPEHARRMDCPCISTAPMPEMLLTMEGASGPSSEIIFRRSPIVVERYRIEGADLHQTVYVPGCGTSTYRISITGDVLIVESMSQSEAMPLSKVIGIMGLLGCDALPIGSVSQSFGKIDPIDNRVRREIIHRLSADHNVYSVGRFATWRNILLDDVVQDLRIVKGMIEQQDAYAKRLSSI